MQRNWGGFFTQQVMQQKNQEKKQSEKLAEKPGAEQPNVNKTLAWPPSMLLIKSSHESVHLECFIGRNIMSILDWGQGHLHLPKNKKTLQTNNLTKCPTFS